ncbi:hypothetical protein L1887_57801 [Cichorium endivia]|nr:hypothetical protein L1887_57801 [Cichorium endivia]
MAAANLLSGSVMPLSRFAHLAEGVEKVVADAVQQTWWAGVFDVRARDERRGARSGGVGGRVRRVVRMHVDMPLGALEEAAQELAALQRRMATDALEEELELLRAPLDELGAEAVARQILEPMLVRQRRHDAGGEIALEPLAQKGEIV